MEKNVTSKGGKEREIVQMDDGLKGESLTIREDDGQPRDGFLDDSEGRKDGCRVDSSALCVSGTLSNGFISGDAGTR